MLYEELYNLDNYWLHISNPNSMVSKAKMGKFMI
jgi:hypothetical protein